MSVITDQAAVGKQGPGLDDANRHGLVTDAIGVGKIVALQILAEGGSMRVCLW
ncbi:MAG: DUF853 family protein [Rhodobacteraceae bacterium]|nr:DUF853 family protein [Paracoccaceae bacterium]